MYAYATTLLPPGPPFFILAFDHGLKLHSCARNGALSQSCNNCSARNKYYRPRSIHPSHCTSLISTDSVLPTDLPVAPVRSVSAPVRRDMPDRIGRIRSADWAADLGVGAAAHSPEEGQAVAFQSGMRLGIVEGVGPMADAAGAGLVVGKSTADVRAGKLGHSL